MLQNHQLFIPEICLILMEMIGGKEALKMRGISRAFLQASEHFHSITIQFANDFTKFQQITTHILMEHVSSLIMTDNKLTPVQFRKFVVKNPRLKNLKVLQLEFIESYHGLFSDESDDEFNDGEELKLRDDISLIANEETFSKLENLTIVNHGLSNSGIETIVKSQFLKNLKFLRLNSNAFDNFAEACLKTDSLKNLEELVFGTSYESPQNIELMSRNPLFSNLKKLTVYFPISEKDLESVLVGPVWSNLKELDVSHNTTANIKNLNCTLKLEKLAIKASDLDFENFKLLINNKSITQSLKFLDVGTMYNLPPSIDIYQIGSQFETFKVDVLEEDDEIGFDLFN